MCGIAGAISPLPAAPDRVERTLALLRNRGPDARGAHCGRLGASHVALLHTRLAIIDLDPRANQPFASDGCVLVFNGEIYNYLELRRELDACGHAFRTASDTEVIVKAYRQWGDECLDRMDGMWAFALLDERADRLLLSRDRFGEKPLYLMAHGGGLYFASEVKALASLSGYTPSVNEAQLARYLVHGYKTLFKGAETFHRDVEALPAASCAVLTGPETPRPKSYWRLAYEPRAMDAPAAADGTRARLERAVETRLRADVPVAFCLSGGIDSGALAALARRRGHEVHAFSIVDRDERYDETANIKASVGALGLRLHTIETTTEGFLDRLQTLVAYHDAPVATISYYVHAFLSEAIAAHGYKVAVSGTAADELFTGYYDHALFWLAEQHDRPDFDGLLADWRRGLGAHVTNPHLQDPLTFVADPARREHMLLDADVLAGLMVRRFDEAFTEADYDDNLLRNRMLNELRHESVPVMLYEDDLNSMRVSIENRSPYLDRDLVEFAYTIPNALLIRDGLTKWPLREAVKDALPDQVRLDTRKRGFNASIDSLLDRGDPHTRERLLAPGPIFDLVDRARFESFLGGDMTDNSASKFLFSFASARMFLDQPAMDAGAAQEPAASYA